MRVRLLLLLVLGCSMWAMDAHAQTGPCPGGAPLAFEGAEGFGKCSQGGRGGVVVDVTNLNNSGAGSLRECAEVMSGPRTCRIMVAGTVSLGTYDITVRNPYLTIDGTNYPMALKDGGLDIRASHTIIRHLRIRPGNASFAQRGVNANAITYRSTESGGLTTDHIADHVSLSWTTDDTIAIVYGVKNVTIQDSILSEGLVSGANCGNCSSKGILVGTGTTNRETLSVLRTLSAHILLRFPNASGGDIDWVNNVDYNSSGVTAQVPPYYSPVKINFIGNYFKLGIDGPLFSAYNVSNNEIRTVGGFQYSTQSGIYVEDNIGRHCSAGSPATCIIWGDNGGIPVQSQRYPHPLMPTVSAAAAYDLVLNNSGAWPRDAVDTRIVNDVHNGTGRWISDPATVGGWPTLTSGTTPPPPPPPPPVTTYGLSAPASVQPGASTPVQWTAPADHSVVDWIVFAPAGSGPQAFATWAYVPAGTSGTLNIPAPSTTGNWELRYLLNDGYTAAAMTTITVSTSTPPPPPPPPAVQCADGLDNDSDGKIDLVDPGCADANDDSESPDPLTLEQRVAALDQALGTTQATLLALTDAQAALTQRVDGHDTAYASLASQLAALGAVVSTVQTQITDLTALIGIVNTTVSTHTASIASLQASVAAIQAKLTAMCQALGGCQ